MTRERRQGERVPERDLVGLAVGREPMMLYELVDISHGGLRVRLGSGALEQGMLLTIEFELDGDRFELMGEVVHTTTDEAGVEFAETTEAERALLQAFVIDRGWG